MTMQIVRRVTVPGPAEEVFALVDDLGEYPAWMELVREVSEVDDDGSRPAWEVQLQAQVGPFARSKRLRMVRSTHDPACRVVFEREEVDGRAHAPWTLDARVEPVDDPVETDDVVLTMTLTYGGSLWTGAVLQRVLDDHVERGATRLLELRSATS